MSRLRIFRGLDFFFILYLYAYLRHAVYGGALIPTTVAALLSRGLAIYVYLRHTGMLPLCLLMCVPGAIRVPPARGLWGYVEPTTVATLLCRGKSRISANIKC